MSKTYDPLFRRDFFRTLGVAALPILAQGCDTELATEEFRAGPKHNKPSGNTGTAVVEGADLILSAATDRMDRGEV